MLYHDTPHYPNIHTSFYQDNPTTVQSYINNQLITFLVIHYSNTEYQDNKHTINLVPAYQLTRMVIIIYNRPPL